MVGSTHAWIPPLSARLLLIATTRDAGPFRRIAHRGTEIFVAVGNEIRWSELGTVKDAGEDFQRRQHGRLFDESAGQHDDEKVYRVRGWHV